MSINDAKSTMNKDQTKKRVLELMLEKKGMAARTRTKPDLISPRTDKSDLGLSNAQQRLWFFEEFTTDTVAYVFCNRIDLKGELQIEALRKAYQVLVDRHEILRTSYQQKAGVPHQQVHEHVSLEVPLTDLSEQLENDQTTNLQDIITKESGKPFDLRCAPLMRLHIVKLTAQYHVILHTIHHIAYDGWSLAVMYGELKTIYEALIAGKSNPLPRLAIQYADYAAWQRENLQSEAMREQLAFWRETLADEFPILELPTDKSRPANLSYNGALHKIELPLGLCNSLKKFAAENDSTLFMVLLTAFNILLHRYTGESDIIVGSPVANRSDSQLEKLIGFFVNTLVMRTSLANNPTVDELINNVRETASQAYAHQELPFDMIVDALNIERDTSHNSIFQVMFAFQDSPELPAKLGEADVKLEVLDNHTSLFDMTFDLQNSEVGISGCIEYCTDLFNSETITRMANHFENLLRSMVSDPNCRIDHLKMLTEKERQQLLYDWNDTDADYSIDQCIHRIVEKKAQMNPEAVAVCHEGSRITYAELNARANQLARYLQSRGVAADKFVGLCIERSVDMVVSMLAILKAGGAYLPLDPDYPVDRLAFMIENCAAEILITQPHLVVCLPEKTAGLICLDADKVEISRQSTENLNLNLSPDNLAYIIYTSGSTGTPKGVMVTHRNLANSTLARIEFYPHKIRRFLLLSSFSFDSSVAGIFWSLSEAAELHLPKQGLEKDVQQVAKLVGELAITHLLSLPSIYSLLLSIAEPDQLKSLSTVIVAGEPFTSDLRRQHNHSIASAELYNEYGPTEGTVWSTAYKTSSEDIDKPIPIGKPIGNVKIYILDPNLQPAPVGVMGEIYIGGESVTPGYLKRDDLTAEKFIVNPFESNDGTLYKTGDLARYLPDGNILFLGRTDHQVKIRGYRIELGEIETALAKHEGITDVVVVAKEKESNDRDTKISDLASDSELLASKYVSTADTKAEKLLEEIESLSEEEANLLLSAKKIKRE